MTAKSAKVRTWLRGFRHVPGGLPLLVLSLILSIAATVVLRDLPVLICIDLEERADALSARWPSGDVELEETETRFAPHHFHVTVTARDTSTRPLGGGYQMIAMAPVSRTQFSNRELWTNLSNFYLLHGGERPAAVGLEGWAIGPDPYLHFERDPQSESVEVQSAEDVPQRLELYAERRESLRHPIVTDRRLYRYIGAVPRRALNRLFIDAGSGHAPGVHRLYVNALIPRIYFGDEARIPSPAGIVTEHWAPAWSGGAFPLPAAPYLGAHPGLTFAACAAMAWCGLAAAWMLIRRLVRQLQKAWRASAPDRVGRIRLKVFAAFFAPLALAWCTFLLAFYPGTMISDSVNQWAEMKAMAFTTQHPPIYALAMKAASLIWDSPSSLAFIQILAGAAVLGLGFALLWEARVNRAVLLALYAMSAISPRNNTMMIALVKDTPYAISMLLAAVCLAWIALRTSRGNYLQWAGIGLGLGLAAVLRYNGLMMAAAALPIALIAFPRQWRGGLIAAAILVSIFLGVQRGVYPRIAIDYGEGGLHDMTTCHLAILLDRDVPLTNEEYEFLAQVRDLDDRWAYAARRADSTWLPFVEGIYRRSWAKEHSGAYFELYKRLATRNVLNASMYFAERGEYLYVPWERSDDMEEYLLGISPNRMGLSNYDLFLELPDQLRAMLAWTAKPQMSWLFWRPALPLYLVIVACLILCIRQRDITWGAIYAPFLINTATVALAGISQAARYQYPLVLASGFLIALAFLPSRQR